MVTRPPVLIAVSTPWASRRIAEPAAALVGRLGLSALIVHVVQQREEDEHESQAKQRGEQTLTILSRALTDAGVECESLMLFSDHVVRALINTADERGCRMLVVGASDRGRLYRAIGRDVPTRLLRRSEVPVLTCPTAWSGVL